MSTQTKSDILNLGGSYNGISVAKLRICLISKSMTINANHKNYFVSNCILVVIQNKEY